PYAKLVQVTAFARRIGPAFARLYSAPRDRRSAGARSARVETLEAGKRLRYRPPGRPVDQFDRVDHRYCRSGCDLSHTADIAGCDHIRLELFNVTDLAVPQLRRDRGLKNVVGARRAAT